jgi:transcriptional regulator with XRE-family HTH domain
VKTVKTLREWRVERLLSLRGLAKEASVSLSTLQGVEAGAQLAQPGTIRKLAAALSVEPGEVAEFRRAMEAALRGKEAA